jgi:hypothetical protein
MSRLTQLLRLRIKSKRYKLIIRIQLELSGQEASITQYLSHGNGNSDLDSVF